MAAKSITKPLVWILMGLLILGLGGFGVTSLSGTLRTVGTVGEAEISVQDYFQGLQNEIRAEEADRGESISFAEAQRLRIPEQVMGQLTVQGALDHETIVNDISVGDANLADQITSMRQFTGPGGEFDREAYRFALDRMGMNESEFEDDIRREIARSFIQAAVLSGVTMPEIYTETMLQYLGEQRGIEWAMLGREDLEVGLPEPDDADLAAFHSENEAMFTRPEVKRITYAWLTPEMILDTVEVDEQALQDAYEARRDEFVQPERRLVERLVYPDTEAAEGAIARLDEGEASFEDLVADRGLELADTDMGTVEAADLGEAADTVFEAAPSEVVGPLSTDLGPALFRVNAVLQAQETAFEEAEPELRDILAADRARRVVEGRIDEVDDLLAGGATIEDLGAETAMRVASIDWHPGMSDDIAAYEGFRAAAANLSQEDYPEVIELEDGGIFAMRLDETVPPTLQPLDEVRDAVTAAWTETKINELLREQVAGKVGQLAAGESFENVSLTVDGSEEVTRRGFIEQAPEEFIDTVFGMEVGDVEVINGNGRIFVLKLNTIEDPDAEDGDLQQINEFLRNEAAGGLSQDLFQVLANDIRTRAGVSFDEGALNAVHNNFQ
ncbi:Peptidyl-prolyl cis-trans isomerase D [Roseovarius sp. THAF9]|uniref:peptidyl-prolyl cis-trans isomerase n=1 Tax=Roseovarius sp. THAF9 TaxID=2587847 RepID=UPI00126866B3|nr:peptidyl-prolyl cis-trans isomerase [Roseovarius sp. THAF9]QFT93215.1 Peptidyl-prolyl cis-trans isomerase D [Roseovarius sp. THAF9]